MSGKITLRSILCGVMACALQGIVSARLEDMALDAFVHHKAMPISELSVQLTIIISGFLLAVALSVRDLRHIYDQKEGRLFARGIANLLGSFILGFVAVGMFLPVR